MYRGFFYNTFAPLAIPIKNNTKPTPNPPLPPITDLSEEKEKKQRKKIISEKGIGIGIGIGIGMAIGRGDWSQKRVDGRGW